MAMGGAVNAGSAEEQASVSTGGGAVGARSVRGQRCGNMHSALVCNQHAVAWGTFPIASAYQF